MTFLESMALPFLACLVLTGIHVYLGIHVISRKVIFVDLALAQIAAFGAVCGALLGWDIHEDFWQIKGFSLVLTFLGAAVFSLTRMRHERVPHEAIIGISYAVALAATILASAQLAHGAEEVQDLLAGSILWVRGPTVLMTAGLYAVIGAFHFACRRQFFAISLDPVAAEAQGLNIRLWDFLFYVSFGFVVTSSVSIAGVLLVFCYLVIPSVVGILFAESIAARLAIGWAVGTFVSLAGVAISYHQDLPSGPAIAVTFGAFLVLAGALHHLLHAPRRGAALLRLAAGAAVAVLLVVGGRSLRKREHLDLVHVLESGVKAERMLALAKVEAEPQLFDDIAPLVTTLLREAEVEVRIKLLDLIARADRREATPEVLALLTAPDDFLREQALRTLQRIGGGDIVPAVLAAAASEPDEYLRVEMAEAVLELGNPDGIPVLLAVMEHGSARQVRKEAHEHLTIHYPAAARFAYDVDGEVETRHAQVAALRTAWDASSHEVVPAPRGGPDDGAP